MDNQQHMKWAIEVANQEYEGNLKLLQSNINSKIGVGC